jgi:hypothetical protein
MNILNNDLANSGASVNSLNSIENCLPLVPDTSSVQKISFKLPNLSSDENIADISTASKLDSIESHSIEVRDRQASIETPSLESLESVYEKIEKFFDSENLYIICPSLAPTQRAATLKPCIKLERFASFSTKAQVCEKVEELSETDLTKVALPAFLAKRNQSMIQRSKTGKFPLSAPTSLPDSGKSCEESSKIQKSYFVQSCLFETKNLGTHDAFTQ